MKSWKRWRRFKWISDEIMQTMNHKLIHLDGWNMDWLIFKLNDSTHCQIDFLAFSFLFDMKIFPIMKHILLHSFPFLFLFLVFSSSVPLARFCKIAVKSVGFFCLLYFFSFFIQVVGIVFFKKHGSPLSNSDEKKYSKPLVLMSVRIVVVVVRFLFSFFLFFTFFYSPPLGCLAWQSWYGSMFYQPRAFRPFFHYLFISVVVSVLFVFHGWFISCMQPKGSICWSLDPKKII